LLKQHSFQRAAIWEICNFNCSAASLIDLALSFKRFLILSDGFQDSTGDTFLASLFGCEGNLVKWGYGNDSTRWRHCGARNYTGLTRLIEAVTDLA
jgi:hypothetical protein